MAKKPWRIYITFIVLSETRNLRTFEKKDETIPVTVIVDSEEMYLSTDEMENAIKKAKEIAGKSSAFFERYLGQAHIQAYVPTRISS